MTNFEFRILKLEFQNHRYLENTRLNFVEEDSDKFGSFFTVLIGQNGTGKTYILRAIIDVFREIYHFIEDDKRSQYVNGNYNIEYLLNGNKYQFGNLKHDEKNENFEKKNRRRKFIARINGKTVSNKDLKIPKSILAHTRMLNDKFPIVKKEFKPYKYLGIRNPNSPQIAGTRSYLDKTIEFIIDQLAHENFQTKLLEILDFLNLKNEILIRFTPRSKKGFFSENISVESFKKYFINSEKNSWTTDQDKKKIGSDDKLLIQLVEFCKKLDIKFGLTATNMKNQSFDLDLLARDLTSEEFKLIKILRTLNVVSFPTLKIMKRGSDYTFEEASSGEVHLLTSFISLTANINDNSIVLIDEPEISLHPNWQMKYIGFLNEQFKDYKSCHFIIATHSHFLISDLDGNNSSIIGLRREKEIMVETINFNTYGWSAEEVLYRIFNVKTTRNFFLEHDLVRLLTIINRDTKEFVVLRNILIKLRLLELSYNDPLKIIIEKAETYLRN